MSEPTNDSTDNDRPQNGTGWFGRAGQLLEKHQQKYYDYERSGYRWATRGYLLAMVAGLVTVPYFVGRPIYHHYKETRAADLAEKFFAAGDYKNASLRAQQALRCNGNDLRACEVMLKITSRFHSPAVFDWQQRLTALAPTLENKLTLAEAGLDWQKPPFPVASQMLSELAVSASNNATYQMLAGDLAMKLGRTPEAETHLQMATRLNPTNQVYVLNLAVCRMVNTNTEIQGQGRATVEGFRADPQFGGVALRALIADRMQHGDTSEANDDSQALLARSDANFDDQLQSLKILQKLKSPQVAMRLQAVQQLSGTNAMAIAMVSEWMERNGLAAQNLDWLKQMPAAVHRLVPVQIAQAQDYLELGDWQTLQAQLTDENWHDTDFLRMAFRSWSWSKMGNQPAAQSDWAAAVSDAQNHLEHLATLLNLTVEWKMPAAERDALLMVVVQGFPAEIWAQAQLEKVYFAEGNTLGLNQLFKVLVKYHPESTDLQNDLASTSLLLNTDLSDAANLAAAAYAKSPDSPHEASTYAYALHLMHRNKDGLAVLQKLPPDQLKQPGIALYYGVLLASSAKSQEATPYLELARQGHLLPEEQRLLETALMGGRI